MHKGQRYYVSCRQLGTVDTKEASLHAANDWWRKKEAELEAPKPSRAPLPGEDLYRAWRDGMNAAQNTHPAIVELQEQHFAQHPQDAIRTALIGYLMSGGNIPPEVVEKLAPAQLLRVQTADAAYHGQPTTEPDRRVETLAEQWLKGQKQRAEAGQMSAGRAAGNKTCLLNFIAFVGPQADVSVVNAERLQAFYLFCLGKTTAKEGSWSVAYARDVFKTAKGFIGWLAGMEAIEPPRNFSSRQFKFGSPAKVITTWSIPEFQAVMAEATGKLKLCILLCANAGMTQIDVSELRDDQVDWQLGYVTRKRTKTANHESVPMVKHKLWPTTFTLLKKHRSGTDRVLLTDKSGRPYVRTHQRADGRLTRSDGFAACFTWMRDRTGFGHSLKELRKLGASLLRTNPDYAVLVDYFLGHSPQSMADRHYAAPPQDLFDDAVTWLGVQLGQVATELPT
jgi:integrase